MKIEENSELGKLREQIKIITEDIFLLVSKRNSISKQIGVYKSEKDLPIVDVKTEQSLFSSVKEICKRENISEDLGMKILGLLINESISVQKNDPISSNSHTAIIAEARRIEKQGKPVIHLEIGEPDYGPPDSVINDTFSAMRDGRTNYVEPAGILPLRKRAAEYIESRFNKKVDSDNVLITTGGRFAVYAALATCIKPGDSVLVFQPAWPAYANLAESLGARIITYNTSFDDRWIPDINEVVSLFDDTVKMIILNTPNNPTGSILSRDFMESLSEESSKRGIYILSDEVYSEMSFKPFTSIFETENSRSILISSLSKSHGMTGFRVGYAVADKSIIKKMVSVQNALITSVPEFIQYGSMVAFDSPLMYVDYVSEKMKLASKALKDLSLDFHEPEGGLYFFPKVSSDSFDSEDFSYKLLKEAGVALAPGSSFGPYEKYFRLCFSIEDEKLLTAIQKIGEYLP